MASIAIETAVVHPVDDRANVVHVMNAFEARQWDVAALFVGGMTDRDFPRQHPQNLLFPDSDVDGVTWTVDSVNVPTGVPG